MLTKQQHDELIESCKIMIDNYSIRIISKLTETGKLALLLKGLNSPNPFISIWKLDDCLTDKNEFHDKLFSISLEHPELETEINDLLGSTIQRVISENPNVQILQTIATHYEKKGIIETTEQRNLTNYYIHYSKISLQNSHQAPIFYLKRFYTC